MTSNTRDEEELRSDFGVFAPLYFEQSRGRRGVALVDFPAALPFDEKGNRAFEVEINWIPMTRFIRVLRNDPVVPRELLASITDSLADMNPARDMALFLLPKDRRAAAVSDIRLLIVPNVRELESVH
jgi:hypothetical protein